MKTKRIAAVTAALAALMMVVSPSVKATGGEPIADPGQDPAPAGHTQTIYDGLLISADAADSALTASVQSKTEETIKSYNATELKKVLVIEDDANIPAATFTFNVTPGTAVAGTTSTHAVKAGINAGKICWNVESTKSVSGADDTFETDNVGIHATTNQGASYNLVYAAQDVHDASGGQIDSKTSTYAVAAGADNVLLNNTADEDTYYAIKTVRLDFTECGFTEPGIYRYYIEETGANSGITLDTTGHDGTGTTPFRTVDVYVYDASYEDTNEAVQNKLRIAGYVMYVGKITAAPAKPGTATSTSGDSNNLEDGLANTAKGDNGTGYGTPNGYEVASATKSEGFKNTYTTHDLTISKTVTGNQGSRDKYFKFKIEINNATPGAVYDVDISKCVSAVPSTVNDATLAAYASQKNAFQLVAAAGNTDAVNGYTATEESGVWKIVAYYYLQDGDQVTIKGLADGTSYSITESQEDYSPELVLSGDTKNGGESGTVITELSKTTTGDLSEWIASYSDSSLIADTTARFTNDLNGTIPTGVIVSVAAPAVVGIGAVAGIIALAAKRKRKEEE